MTPATQRTLLVIGLLLLALVQYRIWFDDSGVLANRALQERIERVHQDIDVLQDRNTQLHLEIDDLRQGTAILEEKAREDLGLVRKGETLILFVEPEQ
jgi:cell division protein FtsB